MALRDTHPFWLSIDVGTTGVKAALLSDDGALVRGAQRDYPTQVAAGGVVEQDARDWWRAAVGAVRELAGTRVGAIALTGQMQDVILVGPDGEPTRPVMLYSDTRARAEADEINGALGTEHLRNLTGNEQDASSLLAKLLWLTRHEPSAVGAATTLLTGAADFVALRLTGRALTDTTTVSTTGLMDLATRAPLDQDVWDSIGIGGLRGLLAEITPGGTLAGSLTDTAAGLLGLPSGIPVYHGPGDAGATTLGAGAGESGRVYGYLGTSGWIAFTSDERARSDSGAWTLAHPHARRYIQIAPLLTAGGNLEWIRDLFGHDNYEELIAQALAHEPAGLLYLPYLNGERSPFRDPKARGAFVGLSAGSERAELYRAVLEGVALAYRHALDALVVGPVERLTLTGGGTRSRGWCQLFADVLQIPIDVAADAEFVGVRGAVLAARAAIGEDYRPEGFVRAQTTLQPDRSRAAHYDRQYRMFRDLYPALRPLFGWMD